MMNDILRGEDILRLILLFILLSAYLHYRHVKKTKESNFKFTDYLKDLIASAKTHFKQSFGLDSAKNKRCKIKATSKPKSIINNHPAYLQLNTEYRVFKGVKYLGGLKNFDNLNEKKVTIGLSKKGLLILSDTTSNWTILEWQSLKGIQTDKEKSNLEQTFTSSFATSQMIKSKSVGGSIATGVGIAFGDAITSGNPLILNYTKENINFALEAKFSTSENESIRKEIINFLTNEEIE